MKVNEETHLAVKLALLSLELQAVRKMEKNALQIAREAGELKAMARSLRRLAEAACNRELTRREVKRTENLKQAVCRLVIEYGISNVDFNGDPRGYAVYLHFPDGRGNTMGGDETGWGI